MTYKETLFFIGKCLTISHEKENLKIISEKVISKQVDWDSVVKVSTQHYVFPALYCNLKRAKLLSYLPEELVAYMKHITNLNRDRNLEIISQAKKINALLVNNKITPIFLKGTGFLLQNFYDDPAERMVGDIDFLVPDKDFLKTIELIENDGDKKTTDKLSSPLIGEHYPRLIKENEIAAVEIHKNMLKRKGASYFNYNRISKSTIHKNDISFLGLQDQLILTILAKQYNDDGRFHKTVTLRNSYDVYLLSKQIKSLPAITGYKEFFTILNSYLAYSSLTLNTQVIDFKNTRKVKFSSTILLTKLKYPFYRRLHNLFWKVIIYSNLKFLGIIRFLINPQFRKYYIKKQLGS
ncbi:MAG: nucleotidyltransferase family protein [Flavobacteriaceae bacterium]|nr:nucleotidyltransferase family protein [Flavobacteriaceae bacterium]